MQASLSRSSNFWTLTTLSVAACFELDCATGVIVTNPEASPYASMFSVVADTNVTPGSLYGMWGDGDVTRVQIEADSVTIAKNCGGEIIGADAPITIANGAISFRKTAAAESNACSFSFPLGTSLPYKVSADGIHLTFSTPQGTYSAGSLPGQFLKMQDGVTAPDTATTLPDRAGDYRGHYSNASGTVGVVNLSIGPKGDLKLSVDTGSSGYASLDDSGAFTVTVNSSTGAYGRSLDFQGVVSSEGNKWQAQGTWRGSYDQPSPWSATQDLSSK